MHQIYSMHIKRGTNWHNFSTPNRTTSVWFHQHSDPCCTRKAPLQKFMPFIQRFDYILLRLSVDTKTLWKVQNEHNLYDIFERWGAEVFDEALEKIEDLGFELALHIFWHYNVFQPILYDDAGYTPF